MARVLIVDDMPDNVKLLSMELEDHGLEVVAAFDGPSALELAASARPDVILLDVMMPGFDGLEVCRRLKADRELKAIPVIMLSALGSEQAVVKGLDLGAQDYVIKPFNIAVVVARVRAALRTKTEHDRMAVHNEELSARASVDALTGVRNRSYLEDVLRKGSTEAILAELPLSLIMLDVDHFKRYNDDFGHPAGDAVLRAVGGLLRARTRERDVVVRYGGEEFAVLLPSTTAEVARLVAERMRAALAQHPWPLRPVTASFGLATAELGGESVSALVEQADRALYRSKRRGRNCVTHVGDVELTVVGWLADD